MCWAGHSQRIVDGVMSEDGIAGMNDTPEQEEVGRERRHPKRVEAVSRCGEQPVKDVYRISAVGWIPSRATARRMALLHIEVL